MMAGVITLFTVIVIGVLVCLLTKNVILPAKEYFWYYCIDGKTNEGI